MKEAVPVPINRLIHTHPCANRMIHTHPRAIMSEYTVPALRTQWCGYCVLSFTFLLLSLARSRDHRPKKSGTVPERTLYVGSEAGTGEDLT